MRLAHAEKSRWRCAVLSVALQDNLDVAGLPLVSYLNVEWAWRCECLKSFGESMDTRVYVRSASQTNVSPGG